MTNRAFFGIVAALAVVCGAAAAALAHSIGAQNARLIRACMASGHEEWECRLALECHTQPGLVIAPVSQ